jgi:hypothetical protein
VLGELTCACKAFVPPSPPNKKIIQTLLNLQEAMAFVTTLERAMDRFVNAMILLGKGSPLTSKA